MDVYLVPVGADKHELYCEVPDDEEPTNEASAVGVAPDEPEHRPNLWRRLVNGILGFFRRMRDGFYEMLAEAERERREARTAAPEPATWWERTRRRMMRWVAESIAEQRLLWHLRKQTARLSVTIPTTSTKRGRWPCSAASSNAISSGTASG